MLSKFSVKRPVTVIVAIIIIMILGVVSITNTGVDLLPEMNIPYLVVVTVYPGAAPEIVEKDITDPIEKSLSTVSSVKQFTSTSSEHYSMIVLELDGDADVNVTANDINDKLKLVSLPKNDMIQAPIIMKLNPSMLPIMQVSIGKKNQNIKESTEYLKKIIDRINAVDGVAAITSSGLVQNMALVMLDTAKTGDTVMEFFTDLLGIELTLSPAQKQEIKKELVSLLNEADNNPDISKDGKIDAVLFLDKMLIPYIEGLAVGDDGIATIIKDTVITQLKTPNSAVRREILKNLSTLLENRFILADGDKNYQIYSDMLDGLCKNIVRAVLNQNLGGLTDSITYDLFQQLIFAQDFEMPAGSLTLGATNYIVKVGDQLTSRDDLYNLPMVSMNLSENIKDYLSQIKTVLSVVSIVNGDKATITDTQIKAIGEALAIAGEQVDDYPQWIIDSLLNQSGFTLSEDAIVLWKGILQEGLKDTITSFATRTPYNWRTLLINEVKNKSLFVPNGTIISENGDTWNDTLKNICITRLDLLSTSYQPMDYLLSAIENQIGEDSLYALLDSLTNRTPEQNIAAINSMFKFIGRLGGEGSVVENLDDNGKFLSYTIDFSILYKAVDNLGDRLLLRINLSSMANISFLDDAAKQITTLLTSQNGMLVPSSAVQISIEKEPSKSTADVTNDVKALLKQIANEDGDFTYTVLSDDGEYINFMLSTVATNLLLGALLAIIILILFLKDIKATFTVGFSIVISVILTFVLMYFSKITLNIVSMGGLALGVGMLVDNSIVVLENIYRLKAQGKSIYKAAIQGAKQVTSAIIASTLTTVIVFLPIAFIEGLTKQIFTDMALTICFSLLASLVSALTIVPMAITTIVKKPPKQDGKFMKNVKKKYVSFLNFSLNHRWIAGVTVFVLLGASIGMALSMDSQLFPDMSTNTLSINVSYNSEAINNKNLGVPSDSDDYYTFDKAVYDSVEILKNTLSGFKDIETVGISKSGGMTFAGMTLGGGSVSATVTLKDEKKRELTIDEFEEDVLAVLNSHSVSNGLFTFTTSSTDMLSMAGMSSGGSIDMLLYGDDIDLMREQSALIASEMEQLNGVVQVDTGVSAAQKEYKIAIDKKKANAYGLTVAQVYLQVAELLKTPEIAHTLRLENPLVSNSEKQDVSVTIYPNSFNTKTWYLAKNGTEDIKIFFRNNTETNCEYYLVNDTEKSLYVKTYEGEKEVIKLSQNGDNIPLVRENNQFFYEFAVNNPETNEVSYVKKSFTLKDGVEYSQAYQPSIDLVTLPINSANMQNPNAPTISIPLYKLLKDESFEQDANGNIIYRTATDANLESIPLNIRMVDGYSTISHIQGRKCITLTIHYGENIKEKAITKTIENYITDYNKTTNAILLTTDTGDSPVSSVMNTLYLVLAFAVVLIYLIMVAQFQSWKSPFIILSTIPLAFTGSLILLFITGMKLSAMALVGLILLMGIVVNNGIVFVDYANKLIEQGVPKRQALLRTGLDRFRPILMTAFTTIVAMLIMALDGSSGGQMLQPLAIATLGGLLYATMLTLVFVPIVFDVLNRKIKIKDRVKALKEKDIDEFDSEDVTDSIDETTALFIEQTANLPKEKLSFKRKK